MSLHKTWSIATPLTDKAIVKSKKYYIDYTVQAAKRCRVRKAIIFVCLIIKCVLYLNKEFNPNELSVSYFYKVHCMR